LATVAVFRFSVTVAEFGDYSRQCGQGFIMDNRVHIFCSRAVRAQFTGIYELNVFTTRRLSSFSWRSERNVCDKFQPDKSEYAELTLRV